jgi:hypothetical protein
MEYEVPHDPSASSVGVDVSRYFARAAILCHFFAIWTSLLALIMVASPAFLAECSENLLCQMVFSR